MAAEGIEADSFLLLNVPDEMLVQRVVGRRLDPETGDIYHLDFSPPPADIIGRYRIHTRINIHMHPHDAVCTFLHLVWLTRKNYTSYSHEYDAAKGVFGSDLVCKEKSSKLIRKIGAVSSLHVSEEEGRQVTAVRSI